MTCSAPSARRRDVVGEHCARDRAKHLRAARPAVPVPDDVVIGIARLECRLYVHSRFPRRTAIETATVRRPVVHLRRSRHNAQRSVGERLAVEQVAEAPGAGAPNCTRSCTSNAACPCPWPSPSTVFAGLASSTREAPSGRTSCTRSAPPRYSPSSNRNQTSRVPRTNVPVRVASSHGSCASPLNGLRADDEIAHVRRVAERLRLAARSRSARHCTALQTGRAVRRHELGEVEMRPRAVAARRGPRELLPGVHGWPRFHFRPWRRCP